MQLRWFIIAPIVGLGVTMGTRWLASAMGYTDAQLNGAWGIGLILLGIVVVMGLLEIVQKK